MAGLLLIPMVPVLHFLVLVKEAGRKESGTIKPYHRKAPQNMFLTKKVQATVITRQRGSWLVIKTSRVNPHNSFCWNKHHLLNSGKAMREDCDSIAEPQSWAHQRRPVLTVVSIVVVTIIAWDFLFVFVGCSLKSWRKKDLKRQRQKGKPMHEASEVSLSLGGNPIRSR